jgi:uncharacterized protein (TIGR02145 family)
MKRIIIIITSFLALAANAQTYYLLDFAGAGASTTISTVKIENLTEVTSLTLNGSDVLRLVNYAVGINSIENNQSPMIKIYPNPMTYEATLEFCPPVAGDVIITMHEMTGKLVFQIKSFLENSPQEFRLSGISDGFYLINVKGSNYQYSEKLLCHSKKVGPICMDKIGGNSVVASNKILKSDKKGELTTVDMSYSTGDLLKFTGTSGIYTTVKTDIPTSSKTITFNFIPCADGDNNNYPVVEIGTQVWMEENLKSTKYIDGSSIPYVYDNLEWYNLITDAYCWYLNDPDSYKNKYGALYNWYAVNKGKLCPIGWHVTTRANWVTLTDYLGGADIAGGKLKSTIGWDNGYFFEIGTNETGFTALPGGIRDASYENYGVYILMGTDGYWWTSTAYDDYSVWYHSLSNFNSSIYESTSNYKTNGYSVRCIKN